MFIEALCVSDRRLVSVGWPRVTWIFKIQQAMVGGHNLMAKIAEVHRSGQHWCKWQSFFFRMYLTPGITALPSPNTAAQNSTTPD